MWTRMTGLVVGFIGGLAAARFPVCSHMDVQRLDGPVNTLERVAAASATGTAA